MNKYLLILMMIILCLTACSPASAPEPEPEPASETEPPLITLVAVGDNMLHQPILSWRRAGAGYDFSPLYAPVRELITAADMAFVNQEGPIAGEGTRPEGASASANPRFNAPPEAGLALAEAGFTHIGLANNHMLDQGVAGVRATADFWRGVEGVTALGINRSEEERREITVTEVGGYRFAWLAYTYGVNGAPNVLPPGEDYLLNVIARDAMAADLAQACEQADMVIISLHWGEEYRHEASPEQRELARFLAARGADIIIGHHPHVVQPLEWLQEREGRPTLVAYSLGNFIASQGRRDALLEGMLSVSFAAEGEGITIKEAGIIPLVMHYERGHSNYAVYPLQAYTDVMAKRHYVSETGQPLSLDYLNNLCDEIWGDYSLLNKYTP